MATGTHGKKPATTRAGGTPKSTGGGSNGVLDRMSPGGLAVVLQALLKKRPDLKSEAEGNALRENQKHASCTEIISEKLVNSGRYTVPDRSTVGQGLKVIEFQMSGLVNDAEDQTPPSNRPAVSGRGSLGPSETHDHENRSDARMRIRWGGVGAAQLCRCQLSAHYGRDFS
jgi:hypothetical protein